MSALAEHAAHQKLVHPVSHMGQAQDAYLVHIPDIHFREKSVHILT